MQGGNENLKKRAEDRLLELKVLPHLSGFSAICEAVEILDRDKSFRIAEVYEEIARKRGVCAKVVECNIRYAISKMDISVYRAMGGNCKKKPRNKELLLMMLLWVSREE